MDKIEHICYMSSDSGLNKCMRLTGLALDEIESLVGRFANHSSRAGLVRGELVRSFDGELIIRHHFTKKRIWTNGE
jgi:hypothetical protein